MAQPATFHVITVYVAVTVACAGQANARAVAATATSPTMARRAARPRRGVTVR